MKTFGVYRIPLKHKLEDNNEFISRSICLQKKAEKLRLN